VISAADIFVSSFFSKLLSPKRKHDVFPLICSHLNDPVRFISALISWSIIA